MVIRNKVSIYDQFFKFLIVGGASTITHALAYAGLATLGKWDPLYANFLAFSLAFLVAFMGHLNWTFSARMKGSSHWWVMGALIRFICVSLFGLASNTIFVQITVSILKLNPIWAVLPMICITPIFTFLLSRLFAFR